MGAEFTRLGLAALVALGASEPVLAADEAFCAGFGTLSAHPTLTLATVAGSERAHFVANPGAAASPCPDLSAACRAKAFLVPGDAVVVGRARGPLSCVDYANAKGVARTGWLPTARLAIQADAPATAADWRGSWVATEAAITIGAAPSGKLAIKGDATYGALDPDRVKRGAVNIGSIEATTAPDGDALAFTMGDTTTLPVSAGTDDDCRVWMRRLGPYLLVDDNNACGGMNVTFRGLYVRKG